MLFVSGWRLDESTFRVIRHSQTHGLGAVLFGKWNAEAVLPSRGLIVLCVLLGVLLFGWLTWRDFSSRRKGQRSEEHTSELQSQSNLVCRLLLEKKKDNIMIGYADMTHRLSTQV